MKFFITGATGFIGGCLARQLREAGHDVVALVRSYSKAGELLKLGATVSEGDITDKHSMRPPMAGVDGVFHVAAWYKIGARDKRFAYDTNVEGTRLVLELVKELSIPKCVYTSTLAVFSDTHGQRVDESYRHNGPWLSEYDRTKWLAHYKVAEPMMRAGLPLVIVQPGAVYGPGDTSAIHIMFRDYLRRRLPLLPKQVAYSWGHVDDTARGHLLAMEKGHTGESYIIAGPPHTLIETLQVAESITGVKAPRIHASAGMMRAMSRAMSVVERAIPLPPTFTTEGLRVLAGVTYLGNSAKAERELGFTARPLEVGLPETLRHEMQILGMKERAKMPG